VFGEKGSGASKAEKSVDGSCWSGTNRWSRRANSREQIAESKEKQKGKQAEQR
jgi:hypothetical protein